MTNTVTLASRAASRRALSKAAITCAAALAASAGIASVAHADHVDYRLYTLGYTDSVHTGVYTPPTPPNAPQESIRQSTVFGMNAFGQVAGSSRRYGSELNGSSLSAGDTAWILLQPNGNPSLNPAVGALTRIGLIDGDYLRNATASSDEYQSSLVTGLNDLGHAVGHSERYDNANNGVSAGQAAWFYSQGSGTVRLGFFDADTNVGAVSHTKNGLYQQSTVVQLNSAGKVIGNSTRYADDIEFGQSAWIYDGSSTLPIGMTDGEHTGTGNLQNSTAQFLNNSGKAAGISQRFSGEDARGFTAWFYDGSQSVNIGLVDANYTNASTGEKNSSVSAMNNAGRVIGKSERFSGSSSRGQAAWIYNGSTTTRIGFIDGEHTDSSGNQTSEPLKLNEAGNVLGSSIRYNGTANDLGLTAWLYKSGNLTNIGLTDAEYTRSDGFKTSSGQFLNADGDVAGRSTRYNGSNQIGQAAWVYNGSATARVGLIDAEHTLTATGNSDGTQSSTVSFLNDAGQAAGTSNRYAGANFRGASAFVYNGANTTRVGLTDFNHTSVESDGSGFQVSTVQAFNEAGQAAGYSLRYQGGPASTQSDFGQSGWFYDDSTNQTIALVFSTSSLSETYTNISFLSDSGIVLGQYKLFSGSDETLHAFLWDFNLPEADRFHDLGEAVLGGLSATQWSRLESVVGATEFGHIRGSGVLNGANYQMPYLLVPVPEPAGAVLLAATGVLMLPRRRRRAE